MKILIATHYFLPHTGGIEFVAYNQAKELVKRGHKVTIVSSKIGDEPEEEIIDGIKVIRVKAWNWFEKNWGVPYPIYSLKLLSIMNREVKKADIVHVHDINYLTSLVASIYSKKYSKKLILTQHITNVKKGMLVNFVQEMVHWVYGSYILNTSNKIIVCNRLVGDWLNEPNKTFFLHNAVDTKLFKPAIKKEKIKLRKKYNLPLNKPIILFVGRLVEKKGFDRLFEARDKDYFILIVGEGNIPEYMKNNKNMKFIEFKPQEELSKIYSACDIFCLPSINEGFPLTILEAMACGLPVITSNNPGYKDYIDGEHVKLIEPNPKEIKRAIKEFINNPKKMKERSIYSRKEAIHKFSWESNINKLIRIYQERVLK